MEIQEKQKTIWVGHGGKEFDSKEDATRSVVLAKIVEHLDEASYYRDYDTSSAAEYMIANKEDLIRLLGSI